MKKIILTTIIMLLFITNVQAVTLTQRLGDEEVKMTVTAGEVISLKFNSKIGYQFKNWAIESGSVNIPTTSVNISFVMPNSNLTIRGVYDSQYIISYNANGGTGSMTNQTITAGEDVTLNVHTFANGTATFEGWAESAGGEVKYTDGQTITPTENLTLYAVWKEIVTYTISYNANGGTGSMTSQTITAGEEVTLNVHTFTNGTATFEGWATTAGGSVEYSDGQNITPTRNLTLYAVWKENAPMGRLADVVEVGDYISYTPVAKTIDLQELTGISQTNFNTADTTEWRVLSVNQDTGVVEIVSADTVGTLKLSEASTRETDGTFSSGTQEKMEQAQENYANAIYILNEISRQYATGVGTGRGLGYNGNAENVEKITTPTTHAYVRANQSTLQNKDPYDDTYYRTNSKIADVEVLKANSMLHSGSYVWLASRNLNAYSSLSTFSVRYVITSGSVYYNNLFDEYADGDADSYAYSSGVRPVVCLKSDITYEEVGADGNSWRIVH